MDRVDEHVRVRPAPALRDWVAAYSGYRQAGLAPAIHRGLPSPYLTLILTLDDQIDMAAHPDPRAPGGRYDSLLGGLHTTPALIRHDGRQSGVQVSLRPVGARALLGLPAGELAGLDVDAAAVLGPLVEEVRDRMRAAATWRARFAVLDEVLLAHARDADVPPEVRHAWRAIEASRGTLPVARIADAVGWSGRHLAGRFRTEIGLPPKTAARVARFDRARRLIAPGTRLAHVAAACGYVDQAHLARDFREFAGLPASRWYAEEFRIVQATGDQADDDGWHD
jgi:AraC-like DNA-binding protein